MNTRIFTLGMMLVVGVFFFNDLFTFTAGAPPAVSGSPLEFGATCANCHTNSSGGSGTVEVTTDIPVEGYIPGETYTVTATISQDGISKFGFQVLAGYSPTSVQQEGTVTITDPDRTKIVSDAGPDYVTHKTAGTTASNTVSWSFDWTAPAPGVGNVEFFGAFNATDGQGTSGNDKIYSASTTASQMMVGISDMMFNNQTVKVYPTLATNEVNIQVETLSYDEIAFSIVDRSGREVFSQTDFSYGGLKTQKLDISEFASGIYFVNIRSGRQMATRKFVKY